MRRSINPPSSRPIAMPPTEIPIANRIPAEIADGEATANAMSTATAIPKPP